MLRTTPKLLMEIFTKIIGYTLIFFLSPKWISGGWKEEHPIENRERRRKYLWFLDLTVAAAKSLQSCPTLHDPIDSSPPGSAIPGIFQERTLEWVAISFSNSWKWKVKVKSLSHVRLFATPWTAAYQVPPSMGFSRQEYWSGLPCPEIHPKGLWLLLATNSFGVVLPRKKWEIFKEKVINVIYFNCGNNVTAFKDWSPTQT